MQSFKSLFGAQDMTVGKPMNNLLKFSIPLLIGNIAQQLYATADAIIVGNYVGDTALAGVGATGPIINLLIVLFMAIATGAGIMVSQYFGARDRERLSSTVGTSIILIIISSLVITVVGIPLSSVLLKLLNTPDGVLQMAEQYMIIIMIGMVSAAMYNIISGILRGLGDSVWPLVFLLVAVVLNIALDIWFVAGLGMGIAGAAWATILAQTVSAIMCVVRLFNMKDVVSLNRQNLRIDRELGLQLTRLGMPAGITQGIMSISMLLVQNLTNTMGQDVIAATTAIMRVDGFAMLPNFTFGMAVSTFVGQNVGANRMDRVERGTKAALILTVGVSVALSLLLILFGRQMIMLFTPTQAIVDFGVRAFRILALGYIAVGISQIFTGIMRGAGDTMPSMWISLAVNVAFRIPSAYLFAYLTRSPAHPNGLPDSLYYSLLLGWTLGALATYMWYRRGTWKEKSLIRRRVAD